MRTLKFTVLHPLNGTESPLIIERTGKVGSSVHVRLGTNPTSVLIEAQQLAEIGALFLALAGTAVDYSGADALLEGFDLDGKKAAEMLADDLET